MHRRRATAERLTFSLLVLAATACARRSDPIVIGLAGPFSEDRGTSMRLAAQLAVREINARGGVHGRPLELLVVDDSAQPSRAVAVAARLRDDRRVIAVIGHLTSGSTLPAAEVYNSGSDPVVSISPSASSREVANVGPFTFRVCADDQIHGVALARWTYRHLGIRTVAVVYQNDDYGRGVVATFAREFLRLGGTITERDPFLASTADFGPYLERIKAQDRARALFVAGARVPAGLLLRQTRALKIDLPILGADALTGIQTEGAIAEGIFVSTNYLPDLVSPANTAFVRAYEAAYPSLVPDHRGAGAYDAVHLIADAVRDGGSARRAVRDALAKLGHGRPPYTGVTGTITFDEKGDVPGKVVIVGVARNGRLITAEGQ